MLKHYVRLFFPGVFFAETSECIIKTRDVNNITIPDNCYGYMFYDREETMLHGVELQSGEINKTGIHYFGRAMTLAEVKKELPSERILIFKMENNGWDRVVKTRTGNFQPFEEDDCIVEEVKMSTDDTLRELGEKEKKRYDEHVRWKASMPLTLTDN